MKYMKRIFGLILASVLCISSTAVVSADELSDLQQRLKQENAKLQQIQQEAEAQVKELKQIEEQMKVLDAQIERTNAERQEIEATIEQTQLLIEEKTKEIQELQDKITARKDYMKKRIVALQERDSSILILDVLLQAGTLSELVERMNVVSTILNSDKENMETQQKDMEQVESDKALIVDKEQMLQESRDEIAKKQAEEAAAKERQLALHETASQITKQLNDKFAAQQRNVSSIHASIATVRARQIGESMQGDSEAEKPNTGTVMYVEATAYSAEGSPSNELITAAGYNIGANPNMKLIAVDPNVIPLGTRVWVEGYGTAIAGDTGGAIKGYKIDVLMPSNAAAYQWGRKYGVKIIVLD